MISLTRLFVPPVRMKVAPVSMKGRSTMAESCSSFRTNSMQVENKIWLTLPAQEAKYDVLGVYKERCSYDRDEKFFVTSDQPFTKLEKNPKIVGSSCGWRAFVDPSDCSLSLKKPSGTASDGVNLCLPPIETLPDFTGKIYCETDMDKPGFHGYEVAGFTYRGPAGEERHVTSEKLAEYFVDKVVTSDPASEDFTVVMTTHGAKSNLVFCRPGDLKWKTLNSKCCIGDVVYNCFDDKFYAIRNKSNLEIEIWDLKNPNYPEKKILNPLPASSSGKLDSHRRTRCNSHVKGYVVESMGNIFLVLRHYAHHVAEDGKFRVCDDDPAREFPYKTFWFDVMKLHKTGQKLEVVDYLDNQALFLGINDTFAVSASGSPGIEPNSIYFDDHYSLNQPQFKNGKDYGYSGRDFRVFNLDDKSIKSSYPPVSKKFTFTAV